MILLNDGEFAFMQGNETVMLFSYSSAGYACEDEGVIALDDHFEIINDYKTAMSRLTDFDKFHPKTRYCFAYDGERTIMLMGYPAYRKRGPVPEGYIGPYDDPIEAYTEAEDIRTARLKAATDEPSSEWGV